MQRTGVASTPSWVVRAPRPKPAVVVFRGKLPSCCLPRKSVVGRQRLVTHTSLGDVSLETSDGSAVTIDVDNASDEAYTVISIRCSHKKGLLSSVSSLFVDLGLGVRRAEVSGKDDAAPDKFFVVQEATGEKLTSPADVKNVKTCLETLFQVRAKGQPSRPVFGSRGSDTLYTLMGQCFSCRAPDGFRLVWEVL